jgi:hypothetical protein
MKKLFNALTCAKLVMLLSIFMLAGCGGGGDTYSTELMSVVVPKGWKAFPYFKQGESTPLPNIVAIHKGAKSEIEQFSTPSIRINFFANANQMHTPSKNVYQDVVDLKPLKLGAYTWEGFTGKSMNKPVALLWTKDGDKAISLDIFLEQYEKIITLEDKDVQAIIASITPK